MKNINVLREKLKKSTGKKRVPLLINLAFEIMYSEPDKCIQYSREASKIAKKFEMKMELAFAIMHIGLGYFHKGYLNQAMQFYNKAYPHFLKINNPEWTSQIKSNMAIIYRLQGKLDLAQKTFYNACKLLEKSGKIKSLNYINSLNNLGIIYDISEKYDKALEYYNKSLKLAENIQFDYGSGNASNNIGNVYLKLRKYEKAINYLNISYKYKKKINNKKGMISSLIAISNFYSKISEKDKALHYAKLALEISDNFKDNGSIIIINSRFAEIYIDQRQFDLAINSLKKAIKIAKKEDINEKLISLYLQLSNLYEKQKEIPKALEYHKLFTELTFKYNNAESAKKISEIEVMLETEQKERKIEFLQKEKIIKDLQIKAKEEELIKKKNKEIEINKMNKLLEQRVREELKKREEQQLLLARKSKLESLGKLAAGIAHEINQPITHISLGVGNILVRQKMNKLEDEYLIEKCNNFYEDIKRVNKIINQIKIFSRDRKSIIFKKIDVNETINNTLLLIKTQYENHRIKLETNLDENIGNALGDKYKLEQVIINLLGNARDAIESKRNDSDKTSNMGKIKIVTYNKKNKIYIDITDNGTGIPEDKIDKIFDPFYTTKDPEKGTGLGLSIVYGIIQEMNGEISIQSKLNEFATIKITLPEV
ncbi:MAG: tetratricopeptide repeat protein [Candidatus Cloacimonetes bacterium]|nr:tetratricopeptide repeat protein [Candidatus Cloacimonadota bacterium]